MLIRTANGGSGRRPPKKIDDYANLDRYAAALSLELVERVCSGYGSFSGFLRAHMNDSAAPICIKGDPDDDKAFADAKRALSQRLGRSAHLIAEWDLVEFVLARCPRADDGDPTGLRSSLAGRWLASQRYDPPGYTGPLDVPEHAPAPYVDIAEAPNDAVRVQMLLKQVSRIQDNGSTVGGDTSGDLQWDREKELIRIISVQQKQLKQQVLSSATVDLLDENVRLRRELDDMRIWYTHRERRIRSELTAWLQRERANHSLTANRMAALAAMFDAVRTAGDTDPVQWMRKADLTLGVDLYALLNHPGQAAPTSDCTTPRNIDASVDVVRRRFLAVFLRSFLITAFGHFPDRDEDPTGLYRTIVRDGVLPSMEVLRNALSPHTVTLQFAGPLIEKLAAAERPPTPASVAEIGSRLGTEPATASAPGALQATENSAEVHTLDVLGGDHRISVLDRPVNALDLVNGLLPPLRPRGRPGDTA
ncbi:hypothetical protein [Lentzea guizhouensis]|nr:hypothetical protein [Lentzea guizhouensis]